MIMNRWEESVFGFNIPVEAEVYFLLFGSIVVVVASYIEIGTMAQYLIDKIQLRFNWCFFFFVKRIWVSSC